MTRKIILIVLLPLSITTYGIEIYFKPYVRYQIPFLTQDAPIYFNIPIYSPGDLRLSNPISSEIENFSLAKGFKYGGTLGYAFNDVLGLELSGDYFTTNKTFVSYNSYQNGIINWNLNTFNISPVFTFSKNYNKSIVIGKIGLIAGITNLDKSIRTDETTPLSYKFDKNIDLGYSISLEYNYKLSKKFAVVAECGMENTYFTPKKAELTKYFNTDLPLDFYSPYVKTILYKNDITNQQTSEYYGGTIILPDQNAPQIRIKETLMMNSIFFGISLKYNIFIK